MKTPGELINVIYELIDFVTGRPAPTREAVWARTTEKTAEAIDSEAATWYDLHADGVRLVPKAVLGFVSSKVASTSVEVGVGICGWVAQSQQPALVSDAYRDERFLKEVDSLTGFRTRAVLAVPLFEGGRLCGVLELINKRAGEFTIDDLHFVTAASRAAGASIGLPAPSSAKPKAKAKR